MPVSLSYGIFHCQEAGLIERIDQEAVYLIDCYLTNISKMD